MESEERERKSEGRREKWKERKLERERDEVKVEGKVERVWMGEEWGERGGGRRLDVLKQVAGRRDRRERL